MKFPVVLLVAALLSLSFSHSHARAAANFRYNPLHLLLPENDADCLTWRFNAEVDNLNGFKVVPAECESYVKNYMEGDQYLRDVAAVADLAARHANSVDVAENGKAVFIFDTEETALSNLEYYRRPSVRYGAVAYNRAAFYEWLQQGESTAIESVLNLYNVVKSLGIKIVFLDSKSDSLKAARAANLEKAGYTDYQELILKGSEDAMLSSQEFKAKIRTRLVNEGYVIVGNIGDQWSDLESESPAQRSFKVPNPMYYI